MTNLTTEELALYKSHCEDEKANGRPLMEAGTDDVLRMVEEINSVRQCPDNKLLSRIELAIAANGGPDFDEKACECDAEVNAAPCRYCSIRDALNETHRQLMCTPTQ